MRFRNLSSLSVNKQLWGKLATAMAVGGQLPLAAEDDTGTYLAKTLRVTIRPQLRRASAFVDVMQASYTCGHISFYPCPRCSSAFLVALYLHELVHAWLHQTDECLYISWDHCSLANEFSDIGFSILGGHVPRSENCSQYSLEESEALARVFGFETFAASLTQRRGKAIKEWKPPSREA